jgi:hypothetical protein
MLNITKTGKNEKKQNDEKSKKMLIKVREAGKLDHKQKK